MGNKQKNERGAPDHVRSNPLLDAGYVKTNREKAMTAKRSLHWCMSCDAALVAQTGKCPVCGNRQNKKKRKGI